MGDAMGVGAAIAVGGLSLASGIGSYNAGKSKARALKRQGEIEAQRRKLEIESLIGTQKVGYAISGVRMEGTPEAVIQDTQTKGDLDIANIKASYAQQAKNTLTQARASLLGSIASSAVSAYSVYGLSNLGSISGSPVNGALESGGKYIGTTSKGYPMFDLTGTAKTGGNVFFAN